MLSRAPFFASFMALITVSSNLDAFAREKYQSLSTNIAFSSIMGVF
jgi:hypothetical protein